MNKEEKSRQLYTILHNRQYITAWVINENNEQFFCHRSNEDIVKTDRYGWCNYTGSDIVAWIRNITFDKILELNKDVLKRLKDK